MWHYNSTTVGRKKQAEESLRLGGEASELSLSEFHDLNSWMGSRPWSKFGIADQQEAIEGANSSASGRKPMKAICDQPKTIPFEKLEGHIKEAQAAQQRLLREGQKLVVKISGKNDEEMETMLKSAMSKLSSNERMLSEALLWKKIGACPNMTKSEVEEFMATLATSTETADEAMEKLKALCKARRWM